MVAFALILLLILLLSIGALVGFAYTGIVGIIKFMTDKINLYTLKITFNKGDQVKVKGHNSTHTIVRFLEDVEGGVVLDPPVKCGGDLCRFWNVEELSHV